MVTCRRADGSELALGAFPLAAALRSPERLRAEEIVLSVPDGPSVATLLSATPVGGDSGIETVVATLQDLAPLEELDRMRRLPRHGEPRAAGAAHLHQGRQHHPGQRAAAGRADGTGPEYLTVTVVSNSEPHTGR